MGDVHLGFDNQTGQRVALKLLRSVAAEGDLARFEREIEILADLRHPSIVQYVAHGIWEDGRPFFAMEWLEGEDLGQRQRHAPLGMRDAVEIVRRSAAAMAAVHARSVVHRDLKLSNIFLIRGKGTAVKLIDFGVVKHANLEDHPTGHGQIVGTPHFMAPEQARSEEIDARADVYSLGAVLFRLVTGRNIFETDHIVALLGRLVTEDPPNVSTIRFDVPEALERVIAQAISRKAEDRFENGGELARALARVGRLNNDPPATDKSASLVRRTLSDAIPPSSSAPKPSSRRGLAERRVVAVVLADLAGGIWTPEKEQRLRSELGSDVRIEPFGDGRLVLVFGMDRTQGDEPLRAARAAIAVRAMLHERGDHGPAHGGRAPKPRLAVGVGRATAGRTSVVGDAIDRTARQLELTPPGQIRIDSSVIPVLVGRFILKEAGDGAILEHEDGRGFSARTAPGRDTPTIGRDKELAAIFAIFDEVARGSSPQGAVVTGAPGVGKSRLAAEVRRRLELWPRRPEILVCRGDAMGPSGGMSAIGRAIRALLGVHDGEIRTHQITKVEHYVASRLPRPLRFLSAFVGELAGVPFPDEGNEPLRAARHSPQLMQARVRTALEAFVRAQATPVVLFIDDLNWVDPLTVELVDWLLACSDLAFAVFAFARPDMEGRPTALWEHRAITRFPLSPLSPLASARMVKAALPEISEALCGDIVMRAEGNPFFLEEFARYAADRQFALPLTIQALVQAKLDRMSLGLRQVLRAAALFGPVFWTEGVEALLERPVQAHLAQLEEAGIIARSTASRLHNHEEWIFQRPLVCDVAYHSMLDDDRSQLHLAALAWLQSFPEVDPMVLARHAEAAGDVGQALMLYVGATRRALAEGRALDVTEGLADRGLACTTGRNEPGLRAELLVAKAKVAASMGRLTDALAAADEAIALCAQGSDVWGDAQCVAATALIALGRRQEGDARATWALDASFTALAPSIRASLLAARVRGVVDLGNPKLALLVAEQASTAARATGSVDAALRAMEAELVALIEVGEHGRALAAGQALLELTEKHGHFEFAVRARIHLGQVLNYLGMFEDAHPLLDRALTDARGLRMQVDEALALGNLGVTYARLGHLDTAIELEEQAGRIADAARVARVRVRCRCFQALFRLARARTGDISAAHALAEAAFTETLDHPYLHGIALFVLARVHLARGVIEAAVVTGREVLRRLTEGPLEEWEEPMGVALVECMIAVGREDDANRILAQAFDRVVARARSLPRPDHRRGYLTRNPDAAAVVELAGVRLHCALPERLGAPVA